MGFTVLSELHDEPIYEGMLIDYRVSPVLGIPLKWRTRISQVTPNKSFTDFQERGPYKYWNHVHEFIPNKHGVFMKDTVDYELPWGTVGKIAHRVFLKKRLESIFNYRHMVLDQLFNNQSICTF